MFRRTKRHCPVAVEFCRPHVLAVIILLFLLATACSGDILLTSWITPPAPSAVPPREPLVPTPIAVVTLTPPVVTTLVVNEATQVATTSEATQVAATATPVPDLPAPYSLAWRAGVGVPDGHSPLRYAWTDPRPGWYLNWSVGFTQTIWVSPTVGTSTQPVPRFHVPADTRAGMEFAPMVRIPNGDLVPEAEWIAAAAAARPGQTWLIGNEPDVRWQDNATPEQVALAYHRAYTTIKTADPTAQVAMSGLSQITPLRLAYLDRVLAAYEGAFGWPMPVDVWTMHAFVLQEKAGDWGVDIPPGFDDVQSGALWTIDDHDDLALVEEQVRRMRGWMADRGEQDKPLWVTEYGILMPAAYGFDLPVVRRFLLGSFDLFSTLRDPDLGYPADDHRLVQRWVWFSAGYDLYPAGDLFTGTGEPTALMQTLSAYLAEFGPDHFPVPQN